MNGPITEQPKQYPVDAMDLYKDYSKESLLAGDSNLCRDDSNHHGDCCERREHRGCHKSRRRLFFLMFMGTMLLLAMLALAGFWVYSFFWDCAPGTLGELAKRATGDPQSDNGVFIDRKCTC